MLQTNNILIPRMEQNNQMDSKEQKILQLKKMLYIRRSKIILVWLAILIVIGSILLIVGSEVRFSIGTIFGQDITTNWSGLKGGLWGGANPSEAGTTGQALFAVGTIGAVMLIVSAILLIALVALTVKHFMFDGSQHSAINNQNSAVINTQKSEPQNTFSGSTSNGQLELEKQKLELEKQKLELEKEKLKMQQQKSQK